MTEDLLSYFGCEAVVGCELGLCGSKMRRGNLDELAVQEGRAGQLTDVRWQAQCKERKKCVSQRPNHILTDYTPFIAVLETS